MGRTFPIRRRMLFLLAALFLCARVSADTIVLKNGRRIPALNVVERGDKIHYETSSGELSLPKSIVERIEKGASVPMLGASPSDAADLAIAPPSSEGGRNLSPEVEQKAVHDGEIDRQYIANLESQARSGTSRAGNDAAMGHHSAAVFELAHGDMDHALGDERTALNYAPEEPALLLNTAYIYLRRSEFKQSLEYLERAGRVAPESPDVAKLTGWAYYGLNRMDLAVAEWKRALALRADPEVKAALDKALRDKLEEESYRENESRHFTLRYSGAAEPALARDVLRTLEMHFSAIESELSFTPPDSIGVILYTQQAFADITRAPSWVGALNDGRLRVPVQGLSSVTQDLSRVLKHELTHSFIQQKTHGRAPTWLQEGLAQWMEGKRSGENYNQLLQVYGQGQAIPLNALEGSWMQLPAPMAGYAYAWALASVEYIVQTDGMVDVQRLLDHVGTGSSADAAIHDVLHSDYPDLVRSTAEYLRKTYDR